MRGDRGGRYEPVARYRGQPAEWGNVPHGFGMQSASSDLVVRRRISVVLNKEGRLGNGAAFLMRGRWDVPD